MPQELIYENDIPMIILTPEYAWLDENGNVFYDEHEDWVASNCIFEDAR